MNDSNAKSGSKFAKVIKYGSRATLGLLAVLLVAHLVWTGSGSSEWKLVSDKDGIRVSTMKTPGYSLLKYKVQMHMDATLSEFMFYTTDLNTGSDVGAVNLQRLGEVVADPVHYVYDSYQLDLRPFGKLDVMLMLYYNQDPVTKKIIVTVNGAPNKKPVDPNVMRVVHLSNTFTLMPVASGGLDFESVSEMDLGLPYVVQNFMMPDVEHVESAKMREMMKKDKYKHRKVAFITELHEEKTPAKVARLTGTLPATMVSLISTRSKSR